MNFQRYLSAKRTVDDRALNQRVEARLADELRERARRPDRDGLRVLEVGAGIGTTLTRFLSRPWFPDRVRYTALDLREGNVSAARERLPAWAAPRGYAVRRASDRRTGDRHAGDQYAGDSGADDRFLVSRGRRRVEVAFRTGDAFDFLAETDREFDLVVAHAFVDLVDPADALAAFRGVLAPGGMVYCPITFDGGTIFDSVGDGGADSGSDSGAGSAFEERVVSAFHDHIDAGGDSRAGRHLLSLAPEAGAVLAVGGSGWVVRPREDGYPADEAYFLDCIVEMVGGAVEDEGLNPDLLGEWTARRRDQIESAELVYCTHQLDLLIR